VISKRLEVPQKLDFTGTKGKVKIISILRKRAISRHKIAPFFSNKKTYSNKIERIYFNFYDVVIIGIVFSTKQHGR